jgi:hypothetical protein
MTNEWFTLDDKEKIDSFFKHNTIKQFWDWWSDGHSVYMEVRIKDYKVIKDVAEKYYLPSSASGVYVNTPEQLKLVVQYVREKATMWFGVNPRKKNFTKWAKKGFGGADPFIDTIKFLFVDIDRVSKNDTFANSDELAKCDDVANQFLAVLKKHNWDKSYCKIASGNGVQILIKLDVPIRIPTLTFKTESRVYEYNEEFEKLKTLIKKGIGDQVYNFMKRVGVVDKKQIVEYDRTCSNFGRVAALPVTKNYKYGGFRWRGILELKNGVNEGISDYILNYEQSTEEFRAKNIFRVRSVTPKYMITKNNFDTHPLVVALREGNFPEGGINNTLWYSLKLLLRDSKIDTNSKKFREFHQYICRRHNRTFTINMPAAKFTFTASTVNNYCIENAVPLIFPDALFENRNKKVDLGLQPDSFNWQYIDMYGTATIELEPDTNWYMDLQRCQDSLDTLYITKNMAIIGSYARGFLNKYGLKKAKFLFENIFYPFLTTSSY